MNKSFNDIKAQTARVIEMCKERGRYCDNAKHRVDVQRVAAIAARAREQHEIPLFGDHNEKKPFIGLQARVKPVNLHLDIPTIEEKTSQQMPSKMAEERVAFSDWMGADIKNRYHIQCMARKQFINKIYAELLIDMEICKMEGWDIFEYPRMMKEALAVCFPKKPVQLKLAL